MMLADGYYNDTLYKPPLPHTLLLDVQLIYTSKYIDSVGEGERSYASSLKMILFVRQDIADY